MTTPDPELELPNDDLMLDLDRLHVLVTSPERVLPESRFRRLLERELRTLCATLEEHFKAGEEGYLVAVRERAPDLGEDASRLRAQHTEIRSRLLTLASDCRKAAIDTLRDDTAAVLDLIGEHERGEVELVEKAR